MEWIPIPNKWSAMYRKEIYVTTMVTCGLVVTGYGC